MEPNITEARALFNIAHIEKKDCQALIDLTKENGGVVMKGYYASAVMISSKYSLNPFKILSIFNEGKALLEDLISENFETPELRYLRYSVQLNTPKFAGYSKNIEMDRTFLVDYIQQHPNSDLTIHMMVFLEGTHDAILDML